MGKGRRATVKAHTTSTQLPSPLHDGNSPGMTDNLTTPGLELLPLHILPLAGAVTIARIALDHVSPG
jgi:hypothetical protein